ncbi:hypothetical protein A5633_03335 [Mycolicibacterium elephantis]|uniref:ceramidase domain-containing protein n=1 Tax=Mycolicibacterium elephantis TaxID=81858 RepID=UPI0007EB1E0A|nr:ceramidase domain-containing protein [Mycolicibacterium elephantis]OBA65812.1 hypothetical protein A5633_03335 [Mycolicibacterium elephantis]
MQVFIAPSSLGHTDCERIARAAMAQPVLAITSLTFIVVGVVVLWSAIRGRAALAGLAGLTSVAVGLGSFAYHGPQPAWAQAAHDWPIIVLALVCVAGLARSRLVERRRTWAAATGVFGLGLIAYAAGRSASPLCRPESLWQYHGPWHVLAGVAAGLAAWAMISRRPVEATGGR